tara:strand:- start:448 stop:2136 length:1689 start_codon:yes stop_codon:yes gene_type:complete
MDSKNVIAAISLSAAVIILYALFFSPEPQQIQEIQDNQKNELVQNSEIPKLVETKEVETISRDEAINNSERLYFENENIFGSISLSNGGVIDDYTFKKYDKELNGEEKIILLNPSNINNGYVFNTGWASSDKNIDLPNTETKWKVSQNKKLTPNNPITLFYENSQGLRFERTISLDKKYLFSINQKIINNTEKTYKFYPYAYLHRNNVPEDLTNFYILHEGFVTVADGELKEIDYDDIDEKSYSKKANTGYLAIGDKYWVASIIPTNGRPFRIDIDYKKKYRASYIDLEGLELSANTSIQNNIKSIIGAKTVRDIDGYAESENIEQFDLVINWGVLYWLVKPMFFILEYFFKFSGNYGYAIILLTVLVRIVFFPLNNYAFKSMGKMKVLQPEMTRLKELHKNDKQELQKAMMKLYKTEGINPASGCFPILVQIPIFFSLYKLLLLDISMRHAPFIWIWEDLSTRDPLTVFNLFGLLPYSVPSFLEIGLLPVAMGATMFLQQKLNPSPMTDPIQKKIFAFFPLFITVILAPFAAGLILYWTCTNILTIIQQWIILKKTKVKTQ